jgi:hypothetical protein
MSAITLSKVIEAKDTISFVKIIALIEDALKKDFDNVQMRKSANDEFELTCRVRTKLLNPIVSIKGVVKIQINENKAKIMIDADTKTNGWFWFTFFVGIFFMPLWAGMVIMFFLQKQSSIQSFNNIFDRMSFEMSNF